MGPQIDPKSAKVTEKGVQKMKRKNDAKTEGPKIWQNPQIEQPAGAHTSVLGRAGGKGGRFEFSKFNN